MTETIIILVSLVVAIGVSTWWLAKTLSRRQDDQALILLQNQVHTLGTQVAQAIDVTRKSMDERLDNAARVIQGVSGQLGQLSEASKRIFDLGKDISSLQEILRAPKLRGNLGELFLGDLLSQILPSDHYRLQYSFSSGEMVDAVIVLKAGLVPVDAKFPLENFRVLVATTGDEERKIAKRTFLRDVKKHIDAIATKYIRTDEGTFDFALMYIPAENIYYESIVRDEEFGGEMSLFNYALNKRVIPVSPNSFYAYLQTILLGLKGLRLEEGARDTLNQLASLGKEFGRFEESFRLIGQHLSNSQGKFQDAEKWFGKIQNRFGQIDGTLKEWGVSESPSTPVLK